MDKKQVAGVLAEIGTLLEIQGENPFRCQAYHNAARAIEQMEEDLATVVAEGRLGSIRGVGETLREKITTLVTTGELPFLTELKAKTPPGLLEMLRLPGIGPKKVKALYEQLGIDDARDAQVDLAEVVDADGFADRQDHRRFRRFRRNQRFATVAPNTACSTTMPPLGLPAGSER